MKKFSQTLSVLRSKINLLRRDFFIFCHTPKAYLYSFTFPSNQKIHISAYNPEVTKTGELLINKIQNILPNLKVHFIGAASLGLSQGEGDIDLLAESSYKNFDQYLDALITLFGKPNKKRKKFIEWQTRWRGHKVELALADPTSHIFQDPMRTFLLLKNNKKYLKAYETLKTRSHGVSIREYKRRRIEFFNKIIKESQRNNHSNSLPRSILRPRSLKYISTD